MKFGSFKLDERFPSDRDILLVLKIARKAGVSVSVRKIRSKERGFSGSPVTTISARRGDVRIRTDELYNSFFSSPWEEWRKEERSVPHPKTSQYGVPFALALLHEVAHAATSEPGSPSVGEEICATAWTWTVALALWGPLSPQARLLHSWDIEAGIRKWEIRSIFGLKTKFPYPPPPSAWIENLGRRHGIVKKTFPRKGEPARWWRWSARLWTLFEELGLQVQFDPEYDYDSGSNTSQQAFDGKVLRIDPDRTDEDDLRHEAAHHLECRMMRPEKLGERNWGLDKYDGAATLDDRALSLANLKSEEHTCNIEVGLLILWGLPWRARAEELNLVEWWDGTDLGDTIPEATWKREREKLAARAREALGVLR